MAHMSAQAATSTPPSRRTLANEERRRVVSGKMCARGFRKKIMIKTVAGREEYPIQVFECKSIRTPRECEQKGEGRRVARWEGAFGTIQSFPSFLPSLFVIDTNCTLFAASFVASSTSSPSISAVCAADDAAAALATCFAMDCADWIRIMLSGFTATVFPPSSAYRRAKRDANEEGGGDDMCICTIGHVG